MPSPFPFPTPDSEKLRFAEGPVGRANKVDLGRLNLESTLFYQRLRQATSRVARPR